MIKVLLNNITWVISLWNTLNLERGLGFVIFMCFKFDLNPGNFINFSFIFNSIITFVPCSPSLILLNKFYNIFILADGQISRMSILDDDQNSTGSIDSHRSFSRMSQQDQGYDINMRLR